MTTAFNGGLGLQRTPSEELYDPEVPLPTYQVQPTLLAVDVSLGPGESRSCMSSSLVNHPLYLSHTSCQTRIVCRSRKTCLQHSKVGLLGFPTSSPLEFVGLVPLRGIAQLITAVS